MSAVTILTACGVVQSCKSYDDDISSLQEQLDAVKSTNASMKASLESLQTSLTTQLENMKSSYETAIAEAKTALQQAINQKADATVVEAQSNRILSLESDLAAKEASLLAQISTCNQAIDNLNTLLAGKVSQEDFDALQQDVAAKYAALTGNYEALAANLAEEEAARIAAVENLKLQLDALNAWKAEIEGNDFQGQIDALKTQLVSVYASIATIEAWKAETGTKLSEAIALVNSVKGDVEANKQDIATLKEKMAQVNDAINSLQFQVNALAVLIEKSITSLVYYPSQYLYGFGTIDVQSFTGCEIYTRSGDGTLSVDGDYEYAIPTTGLTYSTWAPSAHARYHLNPTTADISKYNFSFSDVEAMNSLTRANDTTSIGATAGNATVKNGILDVEVNIAYPENLNDADEVYGRKNFDLDNDGVIDDYTYEAIYAWVSTLALQATKKEADAVSATSSVAAGTVTSDYALVVPNYYGNLILANKDRLPQHGAGNNQSNHIRTSAKETIHDELVTFEVPFNGELDLKQHIETHYGVASSASRQKEGDKAFSNDEFASSGLKYKYELVSYKKSADSDIDQASLGQVDADGITKPAEADAKYIGETYVVRILLLDGNNKTVSVGYVKILIVDQGAEPAEVSTGGYLNCVYPMNFTVKMDGIVEQFQKSYNSTLVMADFSNSAATKYILDATVYSTSGSTAVAYGKGTFALSNGNLVLQLSQADVESMFYPTQTSTPLVTHVMNLNTVTVYAKFAHQAAGYSDLWVKYTLDENQIVYANKDGKAAVADEDKIIRYWYQQDSKEQAVAGKYEEIHANVSVPERDSQPYFNFDMLNTFVGHKVNISGIDEHLTNFVDEPADIWIANSEYNKRTVTGTSGQQYVLSVANDMKTLYAQKVGEPASNRQAVVTFDGTAIYNGTICYQHNDYAEDILNYAIHNNLEETFAVEFIMNNYRGCYAVDISANNTFRAKFLCPIIVTGIDAAPTIDAVAGGGYWMVENLVEFKDWREYKFDNYPNFYSFYGVSRNAISPKELNADGTIKGATTDINGGKQLLSDVAPLLALSWDATASGQRINGKIGYVNNGATINDTFHIWIPMAIKYYWGTVYTEVELTISRTINQARMQ